MISFYYLYYILTVGKKKAHMSDYMPSKKMKKSKLATIKEELEEMRQQASSSSDAESVESSVEDVVVTTASTFPKSMQLTALKINENHQVKTLKYKVNLFCFC